MNLVLSGTVNDALYQVLRVQVVNKIMNIDLEVTDRTNYVVIGENSDPVHDTKLVGQCIDHGNVDVVTDNMLYEILSTKHPEYFL